MTSQRALVYTERSIFSGLPPVLNAEKRMYGLLEATGQLMRKYEEDHVHIDPDDKCFIEENYRWLASSVLEFSARSKWSISAIKNARVLLRECHRINENVASRKMRYPIVRATRPAAAAGAPSKQDANADIRVPTPSAGRQDLEVTDAGVGTVSDAVDVHSTLSDKAVKKSEGTTRDVAVGTSDDVDVHAVTQEDIMIGSHSANKTISAKDVVQSAATFSAHSGVGQATPEKVYNQLLEMSSALTQLALARTREFGNKSQPAMSEQTQLELARIRLASKELDIKLMEGRIALAAARADADARETHGPLGIVRYPADMSALDNIPGPAEDGEDYSDIC